MSSSEQALNALAESVRKTIIFNVNEYVIGLEPDGDITISPYDLERIIKAAFKEHIPATIAQWTFKF